MNLLDRHDKVALDRQRDLAAILLIVNLVVGAVCFVIIHYSSSDWEIEMNAWQSGVCLGLFGVSLLSLLVAAGTFEWLPKIAPSLRREGGGDPHAGFRLGAALAKHRMVPYYLGVWFDLLALAWLTEFSGSLVTSPFVPLLVAFVLVGQQVSRFKTQAGALLATAALVVVAMLIFEPDDPTNLPPAGLVLATVLLSLVVGAVLNLYEKPHNYRDPKRVKPPTHARIYRDGQEIWRFSFYGQDPVLFGPTNGSPAALLAELRERFTAHTKEMGALAAWGGLAPEWPSECDEKGFVVPLRAGLASDPAPLWEIESPVALAHRGGSGGGENTLAAFAVAEGQGYACIETDVRTSSDGVPFLFHDADLERLIGRRARIGDLRAVEIATLELPGGERIPTLVEALLEFPRLCFNLDLKDDAAVEPVARALAATGALDRVCVTSFSERRIVAARRLLGPRVCTGLGVAGVLRVALTSILPGGGWTRGASVLQIPFRRHGIRLLRRGLVRRAHRSGLKVHVWTLNDRASIEAALDAGVDGVMTDDLPLLKEVLLDRGLWRASVGQPAA